MKTRNIIFLTLFTTSSIALLAGSWLQIIPFTITEDLGFITGALSVWLTVVENIWNFPIGIANDVFFFVLFWQASLFADMGLQVIYVLLGFQGWYLWQRGGKNKTALKQRDRPYIMINGTWDERLAKAIQAVEKLLHCNIL